jgi:hypothetical protein
LLGSIPEIPPRRLGKSLHAFSRTKASLKQSAFLHGLGQSETPKHVRSDGSFPGKRSLGAGDGCTADHCQPGWILVAELAPIADAGVGDRGICNGP